MISTTLRSAWIVLAIATLLQAPRLAQAENQQPSPEPPVGPPAGPPPGYSPPYQGPPPVYVPGPYAPGPYVPPYAPPKGPKKITRFDPNAPVPFGYTKVEAKRKGFVIAGAVTFGVTYGVSLFVAAIGEDLRRADETSENLSSLLIPAAGPFLQMAKTESTSGKVALVYLGVAQTLGAAMLVYGLTNTKTILLRNDMVSMSIAPMMGNGSSGLMAVGSF